MAGVGLALTAFTWFGPIWASHLALWVCLFLTLESFGALLHKTEYKATWFLVFIHALILPFWFTLVIHIGQSGHAVINGLLWAADVSAILAIASTSREPLNMMVKRSLPVIIMVTAIALAIIVEGPSPEAFMTVKWLHLVSLLLIGLQAKDTTKHAKEFGPASVIIVLTMAGFWVSTFIQSLPTAIYLIEPLTWDSAQGRVITVMWLVFLMISTTVQKDCVTLKEFTLKPSVAGTTPSAIGSVELAIWVLPLMAVLGFFHLSSTAYRVIAVAAILSAALFIRRFRVLQIREMETSESLHIALATDPLTGALNRAGLAKHWDENHSGATVAFIDLDQFKPINDRHGHVVGDEVLQILSKRIMNSIRCEDVVCRWGGDEFLVVGPKMDPNHAESFCERIRNAIQVPMSVKGGLVLKMDASIGYALVGAGVDFVTATEQADRMMYLKKQEKPHRQHMTCATSASLKTNITRPDVPVEKPCPSATSLSQAPSALAKRS